MNTPHIAVVYLYYWVQILCGLRGALDKHTHSCPGHCGPLWKAGGAGTAWREFGATRGRCCYHSEGCPWKGLVGIWPLEPPSPALRSKGAGRLGWSISACHPHVRTCQPHISMVVRDWRESLEGILLPENLTLQHVMQYKERRARMLDMQEERKSTSKRMTMTLRDHSSWHLLRPFHIHSSIQDGAPRDRLSIWHNGSMLRLHNTFRGPWKDFNFF